MLSALAQLVLVLMLGQRLPFGSATQTFLGDDPSCVTVEVRGLVIIGDQYMAGALEEGWSPTPGRPFSRSEEDVYTVCPWNNDEYGAYTGYNK